MLYYRRKVLLALLQLFGGKLSVIPMQKYLFLFTREQISKSFFFVPYRYGCFSFQANQDMLTLQTYGYVQEIDNCYNLLKNDVDYCAQLDLFDQQAMRNVVAQFGPLSQNELITYTYVHYPFYAINSRIAAHLLNEEQLARVEAQKRHKNEKRLFTIGYEGISLEQYINKLLIEDIPVLCDVRKNAYSQKYGFNKSQLENACKGVGIKYVHVPALGIDSSKRQDLRSQKDYDLLFEEYERTVLVNNQDALLYVKQLLSDYQRIALTCFEKNPNQCHRLRVAKALLSMANNDVPLTNISF